MSVQSQIDRIEQNVANTYSVLNDLGASMPSAQNTDNLPDTAASIKAVRYDEQTLTEAQKAQARENIGARSSDWIPSYSEVGAEKSGTSDTKVAAHNVNSDAHNDIRLLIGELTSRLNALANSDDTTLDQMKEIVDYIKANRSLIESVTTDKVSYSDIVNNLTTNVSGKPLSAAQGVALKALIDAISVPTKVSQLTNDSKFLTEIPSEYVTETELSAKGYAVKSNSETWTFELENGSTVTKKVVLG